VITVVIVSFNTRALLARCLESLSGCRTPLAIWVVDNASADGSADMVAASFPQARLVRLATNCGFAAANNVALRAQSYTPADSARYALLLNPDTVVHTGAIEQLAAFLDQHPRVGVVGPRLLNPDGSLQRAAFRFPTLLASALDLFPPGEVLPGRLYDSWWHGRYPQELSGAAPFPIDHPLGACMLVRGAALAEVGLFDERFFIYSEEIDLCYRIRKRGWAIWHLPSAQVTHVGGAATSQFRARMFVELHRSRARFVAKHYGRLSLRLHRIVNAAGAARLAAQAWYRYARGSIGLDQLRARLLACAELIRL
jgi:N-acetylglucosaminyl-diphospho-decaprenol L-rhamnosyltransferase